jgi:hypothetical protein
MDRVSSLGVIHEEPTLLARGRATLSALIKLRLCSFSLHLPRHSSYLSRAIYGNAREAYV